MEAEGVFLGEGRLDRGHRGLRPDSGGSAAFFRRLERIGP
jgi:hypothetical protein